VKEEEKRFGGADGDGGDGGVGVGSVYSQM